MTTELPVSAVDQQLFSLAVLRQVNYHRCREGFHPVSGHTELSYAATAHAYWMAAERRLSHQSSVIGQKDIVARVNSAIDTPSAGSENLGIVHRYRIDERASFYAGKEECRFRTLNGQEIAIHSYASMARRIVELWMASPGHRENVLDNRVSLTGSAAAFDAKADHCGVYYISQEFAG